LWAKCYPKVYEGVDGGEYYSAKLVGYFLLSVAIKIEQPEVQMYRHFTETVEAIWASRLVANRVPIFWLTREITEALKLTALPVTLDFTTMKLPFEAAVFMLPKGSLTYQSEETDAVCVSYARAGMPASPRGHWVRGFWRDQACGPEYSQHKDIWIEPFWRGGE
jgi:hypothetical protein